MDTLTITQATAPAPDISALLQAHFDLMRTSSPEESCHVMNPSDVFENATVVVVARLDGVVAGIGAYKNLSPDHAELKSMHTSHAMRGKGIAQKVLDDLIARASKVGMERLSLETGSIALFDPARALYARNEFAECAPFGDYVADPFSVFMTRQI